MDKTFAFDNKIFKQESSARLHRFYLPKAQRLSLSAF